MRGAAMAEGGSAEGELEPLRLRRLRGEGFFEVPAADRVRVRGRMERGIPGLPEGCGAGGRRVPEPLRALGLWVGPGPAEERGAARGPAATRVQALPGRAGSREGAGQPARRGGGCS